MKDQHHARNDDDTATLTSSVMQTTPPSAMASNHAVEEDMSSAQTSASMPFMNDLAMPLVSFPDQGSQIPLSMADGHQSSTFPQNLTSGDGFSIGFEDWLTSENFGGLMHSWPFVIDESDILPSVNPIVPVKAKPLADLQRTWYTHLEDDNQVQSGYATPVPRHQEIDDNYRQSLHRRLQIPSVDQSLPSAEYMNLCVRSYFRKFHPIFPVVHAATFRPLKTNSVLLLSICSVGSLLTGHPHAYQRGVQLFERLHKANLAHWEKLVRRGPEETLALTQACLVGQTFGLLSGQAKHLAIVDAFHGTVISFARRSKVFQTQHTSLTNPQDLDGSWRSWVRTEERIRLALGLRIHDAEIASLLQHETFLSSASKMSQVANDTLFAASSAQEWFTLFNERMTQPLTSGSHHSPAPICSQSLRTRLLAEPGHSKFTIYTILQDLCSEITEARFNDTLTTATIASIQECLITIYEQYLREAQFESLRTGSKILWHYLFILLHSDMDLLEKAIGRDGPNLSAEDLAAVQTWALSASAQRCAAPTVLIKKNLETLPINSEPALNVPKCVFAGIICLFCYTKYGGSANDACGSFSEFRLFDSTVASLVRDARGSSNDVEMGTLYGLVDLLKRIGHWEISRRFASIAEVLLQAESA